MPGDEDDRQRLARRGEPALQLESVEPRHRHVEHEAPSAFGSGRARNASADSNVSTLQPSSRSTRESAFSTLGSSSTRKICRRGGRSRHVGCLTGKLTQNVAPPSALLVAVMRP